MNPANKKGQVTLFIIIGIVLIAIVVMGGILLSKNADKIQVGSAGPTEFQEVKTKLDYIFQTCVEDITKSEASHSIVKGGSMREDFPANSIDYNNQLLVVSYDAEGSGSFNTPKQTAKELEQVLLDKLPNCFEGAYDDPMLSQYNIDIYISSLYVRPTKDSFMIYYDYEMEIDDEKEYHTMTQKVDVSLFKTLKVANMITDEFLETYYEPDVLYNLQACNSFYDAYGIKPQYPVDILNVVAENEYVNGVIVQDNFLIVNLNVEGEKMSFAIKPILVDSIC
jgi:hypothetical protein